MGLYVYPSKQLVHMFVEFIIQVAHGDWHTGIHIKSGDK